MGEIMTKVCSKCGEKKPLIDYNRIRKNDESRRSSCKECRNKYLKENAELIKIRKRKYREKNKDKERSDNKAWYEKNKAKAQKYGREKYREKTSTEGGRAEYNAKSKGKYKRQSENLTDGYVRQVIHRRSTLKHGEIPAELVELKRVQLQIYRLIRDGVNN
jgi:hypothetical protein